PTGEHLLKALSQFQLTLVSANAKYDQVRAGTNTFTEQEAKGYTLFQQHCNACHTEPLFSSYQFENNGLPVDTTLNDFGKWTITGRTSDSLLFKVPSLRNLSYTFPYMHDGRFAKLRDVLNHYTHGIQHHPTLSPELQTPIVLSSHDKTDLMAFLLTLNDTEFVFDPSHQYPREVFHPKLKP
ncbi:MAG: c-type cytochrome, partial [Bacteroidota bacterium]